MIVRFNECDSAQKHLLRHVRGCLVILYCSLGPIILFLRQILGPGNPSGDLNPLHTSHPTTLSYVQLRLAKLEKTTPKPATVQHKYLTGENIDEFDEFPAIRQYFPYQHFPFS